MATLALKPTGIRLCVPPANVLALLAQAYPPTDATVRDKRAHTQPRLQFLNPSLLANSIATAIKAGRLRVGDVSGVKGDGATIDLSVVDFLLTYTFQTSSREGEGNDAGSNAFAAFSTVQGGARSPSSVLVCLDGIPCVPLAGGGLGVLRFPELHSSSGASPTSASSAGSAGRRTTSAATAPKLSSKQKKKAEALAKKAAKAERIAAKGKGTRKGKPALGGGKGALTELENEEPDEGDEGEDEGADIEVASGGHPYLLCGGEVSRVVAGCSRVRQRPHLHRLHQRSQLSQRY